MAVGTGPSPAPKTLNRYRSLVDHWSDLFEMPLETVTRNHVQRILNANEGIQNRKQSTTCAHASGRPSTRR